MTMKEILEKYKNNQIDLEEALEKLRYYGIDDMGFAKIDTDRFKRTGIPEVIYAEGKNVAQVENIFFRMYENKSDILATRVNRDMFKKIKERLPEVKYNSTARTLSYKFTRDKVNPKGNITIVAAGTSDIPVAEEAAETALFLNNQVKTFYDVGVAGIHRLFSNLETIRNARVIVVVAGMEGALASVLGGLVDKPIIGVPTSIGYGSNFQGLSALLTMMNSCSNGISVVNINNGFGAACQASLINNL